MSFLVLASFCAERAALDFLPPGTWKSAFIPCFSPLFWFTFFSVLLPFVVGLRRVKDSFMVFLCLHEMLALEFVRVTFFLPFI